MIRLLPSALTGPPLVTLEGPSCVLRPAQSRDWRDWAELRALSRGFLQPWEPAWPHDALSRAAFARRVRRQGLEWKDDEAYSFLVRRRGDNALVGGLGLSNVRRGVTQTAMLGYWVGECHARRGHMTEAVRLILDFAFKQLALHRVEAACLPNNIASMGLLAKLGFSREGLARGYLRIDNQWRDHALYAILSEDWLVRCQG